LRPDAIPLAAPVVARGGSRFDALLDALGIERHADPADGRHQLVEAEGRLELRPPGEAGRRGIAADFPPDGARRGARAHPVVRAFNRHAGPVLDLTAGLGSDAYRLAEAGHPVRACERDPVVFALLTTGWEDARRAGRVPAALADRLEFVHGEGRDLLAAARAVDLGVYLDPMYPPPRRASALPRREIQVLRALLGESTDAASLLAAARERAVRVVVKRPHHAPPLAGGASFVVESKLVRFDVYLDPRRMGATRA
jgi:16S rRNA (guanine1516-N2)-methyltransferase